MIFESEGAARFAVTPKTWFLKVLLGHRSDVFGFWIVIRLVGANNQGTSWTFAYDALGFLTRKTVPGTSAGQAATTWNYAVDTLGRTLRKQDPLGRVYNAKYDERDRLVEATVPAVTGKYRQESQCSRSITQTYDNWDHLRASKALDGRITRYDFDDCDQLVAVYQPGYPKPIRMEYDAFENLVKMTNVAGQSTRYRYDVLNRSVGMTYSNGDTEIFGYDSRSNLIEWNRGGQVVSYAYDELSRLTSLDSPGTGDSLGWEYDELGRVRSMRESSGATTEMAYTDNDLVASILRSDGKEIRYGYDSNDRLEQVLDQQGESTQYAYNERNEVTSASHDGQTVAYQYDPVGRRIGSTLPNGIQCRQEFDERNRLLYLNYQKGARPVLTYKYGHNQLGQRIVEEKTSAEQCKLTRYTFNARRELIASDRRVGNGCGVRTNYRYDLNHNRIGQNQYRYQYNSADQLQNYPGPGPAANLSYNSQGQADQVGNLALTYNQSQQIKTAQNGSTYARYEYDASGRRVAKEVNGEREEYLMLGQEVLKTFDGSGQVKADYFLGLDRTGIKTDGAWKYYLSDGLGSTALLTDGNGNTVAAYDYEDYGATTQIAGDSGVYNPYRYTGQEWDAELGMYNLRARHYSPSLGRFLTRDPIGYAGGSNLMAYCQGDPVDFVDTSGTATKHFNIYLDTLSQDSFAANEIITYLNATFSCTSFSFQTGSAAQRGSDPAKETFNEQFRSLAKVKRDARGNLVGADSFPTAEGGGTYTSVFYLGSIEQAVKDAAQPDPAKAKYWLLSNLILHELGHILTNIPDGPQLTGVMNYTNLASPAAYTGLLSYGPEIINTAKTMLKL